MTHTQIEQILSAFIASLSDEHIQSFVAYGGFFGLKRGSDLKDFSAVDFETVVGHQNSGLVFEVFYGGCYFDIEATQEFDDGELSPQITEDDGITAGRITELAVTRCREWMLDQVSSVWVDILEDKITHMLSHAEEI